MRCINPIRRTTKPYDMALGWILLLAAFVGSASADEKTDPHHVAARVDQLLMNELKAGNAKIAGPSSDEDFLRRVSLDLTGRIPSPREVTFFGLDPDGQKRAKLIDRLLASHDYAQNWSRYWADVIFSRATDMRARIMQGTFEEWMGEQLQQNRGWDHIATELVTATGDVRENGETALIFVHAGQPAELAAETSRIFLGVQIQCANCHDHRTDKWKREQFHELAAFFPRIRIRRVQDAMPRSFEVVSVDVNPNRRPQNAARFLRRFDKDEDRKISKMEVVDTQLEQRFDRLLARADSDQDQLLSMVEIKKVFDAENRRRRRASEYFMPDLENPSSRGTRTDPAFFVDGSQPARGLQDIPRRQALADYLTSAENPWFARAFVNRMWSEMLGEGFYVPVDDLGPGRNPAFPDVLELLSSRFVSSGYDAKWLLRTIANTDAYQRQIQREKPGNAPFAAACPTRLRSDQIFNALLSALGVDEQDLRGGNRRQRGMYGRNRSLRNSFNTLFGFDPSTPQDEVTGTVPQALFLMNSPLIHNLIRADRNTQVARLLEQHPDNRDAVSELYLLVLSREPTETELQISLDYIQEIGKRGEAYEDLMWSLLNSSEFVSKR